MPDILSELPAWLVTPTVILLFFSLFFGVIGAFASGRNRLAILLILLWISNLYLIFYLAIGRDHA